MNASLRRPAYVDRLLATVDGVLAPIWISSLFVCAGQGDLVNLRQAFAALVRETSRLQQAWDPYSRRWQHAHRTENDLERAVRGWPETTLAALYASLFHEPVDLTRDMLVRVTLAKLVGVSPRFVLVIQLHHALGDARSLSYLSRRLFEHMSGDLRADSLLCAPEMSDLRALRGLVKFPKAAIMALAPAHQMLAPRGASLRSGHADPAQRLGIPTLMSLRVPLTEADTHEQHSALFFGALLAGIAEAVGPSPKGRPIRLRIPVDLRRELAIGVTLENACSAIAVEITRSELHHAQRSASSLQSLVPSRIKASLAQGLHFGTLMQTMSVAHLASKQRLARHLRPDLFAETRSNTMVVTFMGRIDRYTTMAPFTVETVLTQTPTWGANGTVHRDALMINISAFSGIWSPAEHLAFVERMQHWFHRALGRASEIVS